MSAHGVLLLVTDSSAYVAAQNSVADMGGSSDCGC